MTSETGCFSFFFFQAEDGIRDRNVTGVQTCALPISTARKVLGLSRRKLAQRLGVDQSTVKGREQSRHQPSKRLLGAIERILSPVLRSEERRVGKEGRYRVARVGWIEKR